MNEQRSTPTAITTEIVGSSVSAHGTSAASAITRKTRSLDVIFLKPNFSEKRKIMIVKPSETAIGNAPIPAPFVSIPKNTVAETILPTSHVKG